MPIPVVSRSNASFSTRTDLYSSWSTPTSSRVLVVKFCKFSVCHLAHPTAPWAPVHNCSLFPLLPFSQFPVISNLSLFCVLQIFSRIASNIFCPLSSLLFLIFWSFVVRCQCARRYKCSHSKMAFDCGAFVDNSRGLCSSRFPVMLTLSRVRCGVRPEHSLMHVCSLCALCSLMNSLFVGAPSKKGEWESSSLGRLRALDFQVAHELR